MVKAEPHSSTPRVPWYPRHSACTVPRTRPVPDAHTRGLRCHVASGASTQTGLVAGTSWKISRFRRLSHFVFVHFRRSTFCRPRQQRPLARRSLAVHCVSPNLGFLALPNTANDIVRICAPGPPSSRTKVKRKRTQGHHRKATNAHHDVPLSSAQRWSQAQR